VPEDEESGVGGNSTDAPADTPQDTPTQPQTDEPAQGETTLAKMAANPESFRGQSVSFDGVAADRVNDEAFVLTQGSSRVLVVASDLPQDWAKDAKYTVSGTGDVVDGAFRRRVGDSFFQNVSYGELEGLAVVDQADVTSA
jgi:hypothetical protein